MSEVANDYLEKFYDAIEKRAQESTFFTSILQEVEQGTGIQAPYIVTGLTITFLLFVISTYGLLALADAFVILYPAYLTFRAIESYKVGHKDSPVTSWLKYWLVLAFFRILEHPLDALFGWMPGYVLLKFLFLLLCFLPVANNGAVIIYENYIKHIFNYNEETAELVRGDAGEVANRTRVGI